MVFRAFASERPIASHAPPPLALRGRAERPNFLQIGRLSRPSRRLIISIVIDATLRPLMTMNLWHGAGWLLFWNIGVFVLSLASGELLVYLFHDRPVTAAPDPVEWQEGPLFPHRRSRAKQTITGKRTVHH